VDGHEVDRRIVVGTGRSTCDTLSTVSWVYSVYEGPQPKSVDDALDGMSRAEEAFDRNDPPTATIREFVEAILAQWPDITEEGGEASPWSDGPMMNNAAGMALLVGVSLSRLADAEPLLISVARRLGVVLLDTNDGDQVRLLVPEIAPSPPWSASASTSSSHRKWYGRKG